MSGLGVEADAFLRAFFSGMFLCGVYEVLRLFRRIIRHHSIVVSAEDFLYWLFCGFYLFGEIFQTSSGEIRWYFIAGNCGRSSRLFCGFVKNRQVLRKDF